MTYVVMKSRGRCYAMGDTAQTLVGPDQPDPGTPRSPIEPLVVGAHGGYLEQRNSPADGSCGVGSYPCRHPGLDVAAPNGTPVFAPENGVIVQTADGNSSPWGGYGPWIVLIQGDGGKFHLMAHLDPNTAALGPVGARVQAGDQIGTVGPFYHTHWEVRDVAVPDYAHGQTGFDIITDPQIWLLQAKLLGTNSGLLLIGGAATLLVVLLYKRNKAKR